MRWNGVARARQGLLHPCAVKHVHSIATRVLHKVQGIVHAAHRSKPRGAAQNQVRKQDVKRCAWYNKAMPSPLAQSAIIPIVRPYPLAHPYSQYSAQFPDEAAFDEYLAKEPFNLVHADILCASAIRPHWFAPNDYAWFQQTRSLAQSLDLDLASLAEHVLAQYGARHAHTAVALDKSLPLDGLLQEP